VTAMAKPSPLEPAPFPALTNPGNDGRARFA